MSFVRDKRVDGEYDRPFPPVNTNPSKADGEKVQRLIEQYEKMAAERKTNNSKAS